MTAKRFWVAGLACFAFGPLLAGAAPVGSPADFAALTIRPKGSEAFDLATGITTLAEGGTVSYKDEGVTLEGGSIRYKEGDFIEVEEASVMGSFGTLRAPAIRFDVASQTLRATEGVAFTGDALELSADTIELNLNDDVAVLQGRVSSTSPELTSETVLADTQGAQAVLVGPYTYQSGPVVLRGNVGKTLALIWNKAGEVSASSTLSPDVQERFAAYLP